MRILHLITPSSRMMKTFADTVQEAFPQDEHVFYSTRPVPKSEEEFFDPENMIQMEGSDRWGKLSHFGSECDKADVIVWHGFLYPLRMMLLLYVKRSYLKKSVWIMWGIDLYNWKISSKSLKALISNHVNRVCRKKVRAAVALLDPDKEVYERMFPGGADCCVAPYPISYQSFFMMEQRRDCASRENGRINVQIGNNSHSFNNHNRTLDELQGLDSDRVHYYFPLSYGDSSDWQGNKKNYRGLLIERAADSYGGRAHFLLKMMQQEEYTNYLWGIDVAIFDADRQNALGNMLKLLYMGSRVYLSPANPLYDFFLSKGINVGNAREIKGMSLDDFCAKVDSARAVEWIRDMYYPPSAIAKWGPIFDLFRKDPVSPVEVSPDCDLNDVRRFCRKPACASVSPYASAGRRLPSDWRYAVLAGSDEGVNAVAQSVIESEPRWFLTGFLWDGVDPLCVPHDALCEYAMLAESAMLPSRVVPVLADYDGRKRKKRFDAIAASEELCCSCVTESADVDERERDGEAVSSFVSSRASIGYEVVMGDYCTIMSGARVMPGCILGDGVMVDAAYVGARATVDSFATIMPGAVCGSGCHIGRYARIGCGVVLPDGAVVPEGAILAVDSCAVSC